MERANSIQSGRQQLLAHSSRRTLRDDRMTATFQRTIAVVSLVCAALVLSLSARPAHAATTYQWLSGNAINSWGTTFNWNPTGPANGAGNIADFSTLNITTNVTVNLDASYTIGQLLFRDNTTASNNYILANGTGTNVLTLDNTGGSGAPLINVLNQSMTISAVLGGTNGVTITGGNGGTSATLNLSGANTYSGVTTINSASTGATSLFNISVQNNSAFGTSSINYNPGTGNEARILLASGVTLANNITLSSVRPAQGQGAIQTGDGTNGAGGDVTATITGSITKTGASNQGADFAGPNVTGSTNFLILSGPIISTLPSQAKGSSNNGFQIRLGSVRMADTTGTSSAPIINPRDGILQVGANNGIATNSYVDIGGNVANPAITGAGPSKASLDLNGFNQTLVGVANYVSQTAGNTQANNEFITNSSTTSAATLTLTPVDPTTNVNQGNLVYTANPNGTSGATAFISDASASFPLSIVVNGAANGVQYLTTPNGSQRGSVTLTSGTLAISSLANGGSNSSIGASTNAAANLVFGGGTLRYTNTSLDATNATVNLANSTTPSTDRNFTINTGSSGTIEVTAAGTTLTMSGGSANTTGTLNKAGAGTLVLSGTNAHTGGTNVNAGTLSIAATGSLSTGTVNVANAATLKGTGTIGGTVSVANGGILAPGLSVGTLTVGGLTLTSGSISNFEFNTNPANDQITVTGAGGLTINGGNLNLYQEGTTNAFVWPAGTNTYTLLNINGGFGGALANLTIANPTAGKFYNLTSTATAVQLTVGDATTSEWTNGGSTGLWDTGGNWTGGEPNAVGTSAKFGTMAAGGTVTLSEQETVSGLTFDNPGNSYTLSGASGSLVMNNGGAAGAITVNNGSHTIAVPISTSKTISTAFLNSSALTISQAISGGAPLQVSGAGTINLTANNSYSTTSLSASTLNVGTFGGSDTAGSLGTGNLTMSNAATLNFNRSNAYAFAGGIAGSGVGAGTVNQLGSGTTTVSGAISNVTSVSVSAGTLVASSTISQNSGIALSGTGSLTANGSVSGTGGLTMGSSGTVNLNAANSYSPGNLATAGTTVNSGTVNLNAAGALPTNTSLAVNGGTLNLNANNISLTNVLDLNTSTGVITNNGAANTTSTITFAGTTAQNYDFYAALNDGVNGGKIAVVTSIGNTAAGPPIFTAHFHAASTFSGGLTVNSQSIQADTTNAFGTGPITVALNNGSTSSSQIFLPNGVTIPNNITIAQGHPVPNNGVANGLSAVISQTAAGADATVNGTVTIQANNLNGGLFQGPAVGGADFLNINGAVNTSGTANTIVQTGGQVKYSGGGSYPNLAINGTAALGATNGLAQNALLQFSVAASGSPGVAALSSTLDLNGFDQTAVALSATAAGPLTATVQNSGGGTKTLTLNTTGTTTYNGAINGNVNLVAGGSGTQQLTGTGSTYTGSTTLTGTAVLAAASINDGLQNTSIGASSNAAANLVFDGGTLRYTGGNQSTDRGFTINAGKTAKIDVSTAATNLTLTGSSGASNGGLTKLGLGKLTIDAAATHGYTGATTVSAGTLAVNNALTSTSSISIASGAMLTGSGSIGGTLTHTAGTVNPGVVGGTSAGTFTFTGALTLNGGTVQYDVDGSQLGNNAAQDVVTASGGLTLAGASTIDLEFLSPTTPAPFDYVLFNYTGASLVLSPSLANLNYITNIPARAVYTTSATTSQVKVHVVANAAANLNWNSTSSGVWDINTTANWFNTGTSLQDKFFNGDNITFQDGAGLQGNITLNTTASPGSMLVTSNSLPYTISGTGNISGAGSLTVSGTSTLTMKTNNNYSGGTTINAGGTVDVGGTSASGSLGSGDVTNNGTLRFTRTDGNGITPLTIVNNVNGTGNLFNTCPGNTIMSGNINQNSVTLNGNGTTTISGSVNTTANLTISGSTSSSFTSGVTTGTGITVSNSASVNASGGISGAGGITMNSTAFFTVQGSSSNYDGATIINAGQFFPNSPTAFGSTVGSTTVNPGGSIFSVQTNTYNGEAITINGTGTANNGALHAGGPAFSTFDGPVTVATNSLLNIDTGSTLAVFNTNALTGSNVTVTLAGPGTLSMGGNVNLGATGVIAAGTTLLALAPPPSTTITISNPITGSGGMTSTGSGTPNQGTIGTAILAVDSPSYTGQLTIQNGVAGTGSAGNVQVNTANGAGTGNIFIAGSTDDTHLVSSLQINPTSAGITLANTFNVGARRGNGLDVPHVENITGNNILSSAITTSTGGTDYNFQSDAGSLTVQSAFNTTGLTGLRRLKLQGAGNGTWSGNVSEDPAAQVHVTKNGGGTWTLSGNNTYTGDTTVNGGTLKITKTFTTGGAVSVADTALLQLPHSIATPNNVVLRTANLSTNTTGQVDIVDNKLIIVTGDLPTVEGLVNTGYAGGAWTGGGIITSLASATAAGGVKGVPLTTVGVAMAGDIGKGTHGGVGVNANDVLVMSTYAGDANLNGTINGDDYFRIDSHYAGAVGFTAVDYENGDFNHSATINGDDYFLIDSNYVHQGSAIAPGSGLGGVSAVPEPASIGVIALAACGVLARRRRR